MNSALRNVGTQCIIAIFVLLYAYSVASIQLHRLPEILLPLIFLFFFLKFPSANTKKAVTFGASACALGYLILKLLADDSHSHTDIVSALALQLPFLIVFLNWCSGGSPTSDKLQKIADSSVLFFLFIAAATCALLIQFGFCFSPNIWIDEAFSLALTGHSWSDMLAIAATDVHPPLYYLILKSLTEALHFLLPQLSVICIGKLISVLPYVVLLATAATKVRRTWGNYVGGLWALSLFAAPSLITQGVEIRMYGWAMLFVTLAYLFAYDIITKNSKRDWCFFTIAGLASAYTHYYACLAVTPVYLLLLYTSYRQGGKTLLRWFAAGAVTVIGYLPWLFIFLSQARTVSGDYWIHLPLVKDYYEFAANLFQNGLTAGFVCLIILLLFCALYRHKENRPRTLYLLTGILCAAFTIGVGLAASYLIRPVFVFRYMYPGLACLWLALIITCTQTGKPHLKLAFAVILAGLYLCQLMAFGLSEGKQAKEHYKLMKELDKHPHAVLITNSTIQQCSFSTLTGSNCLSFEKKEPTPLFKKVYGACRQPNIPDIEAFLQQKNHPTYIVMIFDEKGSGRPELPFLQKNYAGEFKSGDSFDMYVIPATENGAEH